MTDVTDLARKLADALGPEYTVERPLGEGGFAVVFLVRDLSLKRPLAVKLLSPDVITSKTMLDRFRREAETIAQLSHPNIVPLHFVGERDGLLYLAMQYVDGGSIADRLKRQKRLPVDEAARITCEVASALAHAHKRGVVHRDIKPANVLVDEDSGRCLVTDFGIARSADTPRLTATGMMMGTPAYLSPEQVTGEPSDHRVDIFALGVMLYEMLAGQAPYEGPTASAALMKRLAGPPPSITMLRADVPAHVAAAITGCLATNPDERFQSGTEVIAALAGGVVPTGSRATRTMPVAGRGKSLRAAAMVAIVVAAIVGVWRIATRPMSATPAPNAAQAALRSRIAVLYLEDRSPDGKLREVADGLTEQLINTLQPVPGLSVISRTGVAAVRSLNVGVDSVARILQVGTVVNGFVDDENDRFRVTMQLVDDAGIEMDRFTFTTPLREIARASDSIVSQVTALVRKRVGSNVTISRARTGTKNSEAWLGYQRAVRLRDRGDSLFSAGAGAEGARAYASADSVAAVVERMDPRWIDPPILRGTMDYWRSRRLPSDSPELRPLVASGLAHAGRALEIDGRNADALELLGTLRYWSWLTNLGANASEQARLIADAQADLESSVKINPAQAGAYAVLSHLYNNVPGDRTRVRIAAAKALESDLFLVNADVILGRLILAAFDDDDYPDAQRWSREAARRFPRNQRLVRNRLMVMAMHGAHDNAATVAALGDTLVRVSVSAEDQSLARSLADVVVAVALGRAGQKDSARTILRATPTPPGIADTFEMFAAYAWAEIGDASAALEHLRVLQQKYPSVGSQRDSWMFRGIAQDPRFQALYPASQPK